MHCVSEMVRYAVLVNEQVKIGWWPAVLASLGRVNSEMTCYHLDQPLLAATNHPYLQYRTAQYACNHAAFPLS